MSKIFGPSMRKIASNTGLLLEDSERYSEKTANDVERKNTSIFAVPSVPKAMNNKNITSKSSFFNSNVELSEPFEDISKIEFESIGNEVTNIPSTSVSSFQHERFSNKINPCPNKFSNTVQERSRLFCPAPRKTLLNSRSQSNGQNYTTEKSITHMSNKFAWGMGNGNGRTVLQNDINEHRNEYFAKPSKFGLGFKNYPQDLGMSLQNTRQLNSGLGLKNNSIFSRILEMDSKNAMMDVMECESSHNSMTSLQSRNIDVSNTLSHFNSGVRNSSIIGGSSVWERIKHREEPIRDEGVFLRPSISRFTKPHNVGISSSLLKRHNFEPLSRGLSSSNRFSVTHIGKKHCDASSDSKLCSRMGNSHIDNRSVSGISVVSVESVLNILENLHHSFLNLSSNIPIELIRKEIDQAKELVENKSEMSFAPIGKDIDGASVISHSSRFICPSVSDKQMEKTLNNSFSLKSGKEILSVLVSKNQSSKVLPRIDEERKSYNHTSAKLLSDEEMDDSALSFKRPKPFHKIRKKKSSQMKIKSPLKNVTSKVINLKQWYPVATGTDLLFCGIIENGTHSKTEAVKKRLTNRKIILINGFECNLIGSPSQSEVSQLSDVIKSGLKDGLTCHWRMFQKNLLNYQTVKPLPEKKKFTTKLKEESSIYDTTPKTRRKTPLKNKSYNKNRVSLAVSKKPTKKMGRKSQSTNKTEDEKSTSTGKRKSQGMKCTPHKNAPNNRKKPVQKVISKNGEKSAERKGTPHRNSSEKKHTPASANKSPKKVTPNTETKISTTTPQIVPNTKKLTKTNSQKTASVTKSPKKDIPDETPGTNAVHSSTEEKHTSRSRERVNAKRKRETSGGADTTQKKKRKSLKGVIASTEDMSKNTVGKGKKIIKNVSSTTKEEKLASSKGKTKNKKKNIASNKNTMISTNASETSRFDDDFELQLDDIEIPEIANVSEKLNLNRSQLRMISMETPPLKYFNTNLKLPRNVTPVQSPDWCISQRTDSEVRQFQRRRALAHKKKIIVEKSVVTKTTKAPKSFDVKNVMDWVAEKTVRTPTGSKLLQYMIPSRKKILSNHRIVDYEDDDEEDEENEAFED
ncbi:hypothetical protein RUM44_000604 [Polyplax serrata]|uniref:BRCT domain-containing protein n=1 Tax=Polyplax serrata TaxID=468196 RepID=A0ABR1B844_POLSC